MSGKLNPENIDLRNLEYGAPSYDDIPKTAPRIVCNIPLKYIRPARWYYYAATEKDFIPVAVVDTANGVVKVRVAGGAEYKTDEHSIFINPRLCYTDNYSTEIFIGDNGVPTGLEVVGSAVFGGHDEIGLTFNDAGSMIDYDGVPTLDDKKVLLQLVEAHGYNCDYARSDEDFPQQVVVVHDHIEFTLTKDKRAEYSDVAEHCKDNPQSMIYHSEEDGIWCSSADPLYRDRDTSKDVFPAKEGDDRLFIGIYPAGIVYADRKQQEHGDYKRLAFLSYDTLKLDIEGDCPGELVGRIKDDAAGYKKGNTLRLDAGGQSITLGTLAPDAAPLYAMCCRGYEGAEPDARFTFNAVDDKDANAKAFGWAQYHGLSFYTDEVNAQRSDVTFRLAQGREIYWQPNNEYVDQYGTKPTDADWDKFWNSTEMKELRAKHTVKAPDLFNIEEINLEQATLIFNSVERGDDRKPLGRFVVADGDGKGWSAIDNSAGSAFTEHFKTRAWAESWLRGEFELQDSSDICGTCGENKSIYEKPEFIVDVCSTCDDAPPKSCKQCGAQVVNVLVRGTDEVVGPDENHDLCPACTNGGQS